VDLRFINYASGTAPALAGTVFDALSLHNRRISSENERLARALVYFAGPANPSVLLG